MSSRGLLWLPAKSLRSSPAKIAWSFIATSSFTRGSTRCLTMHRRRRAAREHMSMLRDRSIAGLALMAFAMAAQSADPAAPNKAGSKRAAPDLEFLEYLGTLESDGENWTDAVNADLAQAQPKPKRSIAKDKSKTEAAAKNADSEK